MNVAHATNTFRTYNEDATPLQCPHLDRAVAILCISHLQCRVRSLIVLKQRCVDLTALLSAKGCNFISFTLATVFRLLLVVQLARNHGV